MASYIGFHHVRTITTGEPRFWPSFVRIGTWPGGQIFQNLSGLGNALWVYIPGSSGMILYF